MSQTGLDLWFETGAKKQSLFLAMEDVGVSEQVKYRNAQRARPRQNGE